MGRCSCSLVVLSCLCGALLRGAHPAAVFEAGGRSSSARRRLLTAVALPNSTKGPENKMTTNTDVEWSYLAAGLGVLLSMSLLIVMAVKFRLFHRFLASYRHSLLQESDGASQYGQEEGSFPSTVNGRMEAFEGTQRRLDDDDDGFIEDNYIQSSEKDRAQRERKEEEEMEDSDDDLQFSIG